MATFAFKSKAKGNVSFTDEFRRARVLQRSGKTVTICLQTKEWADARPPAGMNETRHFPINACGVQVRPQSEARETEAGSRHKSKGSVEFSRF